MTTQLQLPAKSAAYLLEFTWPDPAATPVRLTTWTADFAFQGDDYASEPRMEVKLPPNTGGLEERQLEILMPTDADPLFALLTREVHADVEVSVIEMLGLDEVSPESRLVYVGTLTEADENSRDVEGQTLLRAASIKERLKTPLGIAANSQCAWNLYGFACSLFEANFSDVGGTLSVASGKTVTVTGLAAAPWATYYNQGWLMREGLRLKIRDWSSSDPTTFHLIRRPPTSWVGASVTAVAGCDKTSTICSLFGNLERFMGNGIGIPAWSPTFEAP